MKIETLRNDPFQAKWLMAVLKGTIWMFVKPSATQETGVFKTSETC